MSWPQKQVFVDSFTEVVGVARRTGDTETSRRNFSCKYFFNTGKERVQVCKKMFIATTGLTDYFIRTYASGAKGEYYSPLAPDVDASDSTSSGMVSKTRQTAARENVREFLNKLPSLPSHYCRKLSSKQYLEPIFNSYCQLYRVYCTECQGNQNPPASRQTFMEEFRTANLEIFHPRKDQCDTCVSFKQGNIPEHVYNQHRIDKEIAQEEKARDKAEATQSNGDKVVLTMDLQSVLLSPSLKASALYYRTKLCVHNFTIFNCVTKDVVCYVWHEAEGGLTANEFASCIVDYLSSDIKAKHFILYSDGCTYQNRNATLTRALTFFSQTYGKEIEQKFLEKGHTQMEADSVHSTIERYITNKEIYCPADYVSHIKSARLHPTPYKVKYLDFSFFKDFSNTCTLKSIRPGKKVGEPQVVDLRGLQYLPGGQVMYKLSHGHDWQAMSFKRSESTVTVSQPSPLYTSRRKIASAKYIHLQELKSVIPSDYHSFYDELPHD